MSNPRKEISDLTIAARGCASDKRRAVMYPSFIVVRGERVIMQASGSGAKAASAWRDHCQEHLGLLSICCDKQLSCGP